jgi:hypothetical protein
MPAKRTLDRIGPFDWLIGILLSWLVPLNLLLQMKVDYMVSLLLWLIPIICILPRFLMTTHPGSRRRKAVWITAVYVLLLGAVLDVIFGRWILAFDCRPDQYIGRIFGVPIEEFLFYFLGGLAIALTYFWADEYWLAEYNVRRHRPLIPAPGKILAFSLPALGVGIVLAIAGVILKKLLHGPGFWIPIYFTFLIALAFVPAMVLYRATKGLINWRAFSLTCVYILLTSLLWEVTLGVPNFWWRYQPNGMLGRNVGAWSFGAVVDCHGVAHPAIFPIEALIVWLAVSFSVILFYEAAKAYFYDERPPRKRLVGPAPWEEGGQEGDAAGDVPPAS